MESEGTVNTNGGSLEAQVALAALACTLYINENALKTALNGAVDLLPTAQNNPTLALQLRFSRLDYRIDSQTLYAIVRAFRQAFGAVLDADTGKSDGEIARRVR
jgi:hypothetical protein